MSVNDYANRGSRIDYPVSSQPVLKGGWIMIITNRNKKTNPLYKKIYSVWYNMMYRCYNKKCKDYKYYGQVGVVVEERWHTFNNFVEDVDKITGFDLNLFLLGKLELDKDTLKENNKVYCLEFCSFVEHSKNNKYKPNQQKTVIAISPDNIQYEFVNQSEFARLHGLRQSTISDCLSGIVKRHKGWKFYYKSDGLEDSETIESIT